MQATRRRPGAETLIELGDDGTLRTRTETAIPHRMLQRLHERGAETGRAALGDRHGAWQLVAEIPAALIYSKMHPEDWQDPNAFDKAVLAIARNPEFSAFRADGRRRI